VLCLNVIICLIEDWNIRILCVGRYFWWGGEVKRMIEKIAMGFRRMGFLVHVRRLRKLQN